MRILLDPIYSGHLSRCSTSFKMRSLIEYGLSMGRQDWFYYWMIPPMSTLTEDEKDWLPKHPQIRYIEFPYLEDRMREYLRYPAELDMIEAFNGDYWDFDVLVTARTSQIANSRAVMSSPRQKTLGRLLKKIVLIEEMMVLDTRATVAKSDVVAQEFMTIGGYLNSDLALICTDAERIEIHKAARKYLAPSVVRDMDSRIVQALPITLSKPARKADEFAYYKGDRPMCISFTGRMEKVSSNLESVFDVMTKQFIMGGSAGMKLLITTVSKAAPLAPPDFVEMRRPNRDDFWKACREEMDLMLILHVGAETSLSLLEPMLLGVPPVIIDATWSRNLWGPDYPFYVSNTTEAYAVCKMFRDDYPGMYARFWTYMEDVFIPRLTTGDLSKTYYPLIYDLIAKHEEYLEGDGLRRLLATRNDGPNFGPFAEEAVLRPELTMFDFVRELGAAGKLEFLHEKTRDNDRNRRRIVFATPWNEFRLMLKAFWKFTDASTTVGHLRRVDA
jgi:hypothetical protein